MSDSPWNVKSRRRRAPQSAITPQSAQVQHVPLKPPVSPGQPAGLQPKARRRKPRRPLFQRRQPAQAQPAQSHQTKKARPPISKAFLGLAALLLVFALASGLLLSGAQGRLSALVAEREAEAQRLLDHKQAHYSVRSRSGYHELIKKYAVEYGISPSFLSAIIKCESSFNTQAVSRVNARGLMQIMPDTGTWLAGRLNLKNYQPDALFDPETNIRFGAFYLAYLSDMFAGSPVMVASAYHAGANNVKHWALNRSEDRKTITLDQIPMDDTRSYVRKVMDAYAIYYEQDEGSPAAPFNLQPAVGQRAGAGR